MTRKIKRRKVPPMGRRNRDPFETRSKIVGVVFFLLLTVLVGRAFQLQVWQHDWWANLARQIQSKEEKLTHRRGPILDRNAEALAFSLDVDSVYAEPHRVENPEETAKTVARILEMNPKVIEEKLAQDRYFVWIKRRITPEQSAMLDNAPMAGIGRIRESDRRYPYADLAAQVIGFSGMDAEGLEGLEYHYDEQLKGEPGHLLGEVDAHGKMLFPDGVKFVNSSMGGSVKLTIDAKIQYFTEQALEDGWKKANARYAMAIVTNPMTGEILAMAQRPSYNPNDPSKFNPEFRKNHAVVDVFEPGSVMKPFVISGAIETSRVSMDEMINCEGGSFRVGAHIIHDTHGYGPLSVSQIVQKSSNIGTAKIAMRMGPDEVHKWLSKFGFGERSGVDFPGEGPGLLRPPGTWSKIALANVAFGQGIAASPMQMLTAYGALVNGGVLMQPYIVAEVRDTHGNLVRKTNPTIVRRVISEQTSRRITDIMTLVTMQGGTGTAAALADYAVAGKTGTAQKVDPKTRCYSPSLRVGSFIGAVPAKSPKIAIYVVMDEPSGSQAIKYGGICAAPVFKVIAERTMQYLEGAKGRDIEPKAKPEILKIAQEDAAEGEAIQEFAGVEDTQTPNLVGLPIKEVIRLAGMKNIKVTLVGSGIAVKQEPQPGSELGLDRHVKVEFLPAG